jgi:hypothetical protein
MPCQFRFVTSATAAAATFLAVAILIGPAFRDEAEERHF